MRMKYAILIGEMAKHGISNDAIAECIEVHRNTASNKLNGGTFSIEEAEKIRDKFFPTMSLEYLFKRTADTRIIDI